MPAIFNTADGIIEIPLEDIEKPLAKLIAENKIPVDTSCLYKVPNSSRIVEEEKFCQVDPQIRDSAFSKFSAVLCVFAFFLTAGFALIAASQPHQHNLSIILVAFLAAVLLILVPVSLFFRKRRIIISKEGKVKVTDFGIAKAATSNTITSNVMGSVHYTSPEQARGGYSDEKSDNEFRERDMRKSERVIQEWNVKDGKREHECSNKSPVKNLIDPYRFIKEKT